MTEQDMVLLCCLALPVLIVAVGIKFHRAYNRPLKRQPER